ncbi:MAG: RNA pseudouridine synthase, partial [Clostridia bacterium]|nr:RNA pseudouridine synthase [Clostridia bacterium]
MNNDNVIYLECETGGVRLDAFVAENTDLSRNAVATLCEKKAVTVNGNPAKKNAKLKSGDGVAVALPEPEETDITAEDIPIDIVYEDGDLLVVNKPKGMVVHPAVGNPDGTLVNALLYHCGASLSGI